MTDQKKTYRCKECDKTIAVDVPNEIPVCCSRKMEIALEQCTAVHPEMARTGDSDDPCDDGRGQGL